MSDYPHNGDTANANDTLTSDPEYFDQKETHDFRADTFKSIPISTLSAADSRLPMPNGTLQHLSDLLGRNTKLDSIADFKGSLPNIPVNDLRGEEASAYTREECVLRRSLAALYRLVDIRGWSQSIYNHISARCTGDTGHFLINPFGLLYHEIQASSFVKIDDEGNVIQQGSTVLSVNTTGWTLHSALHASRPDINCIVHVHLPDVIAVSCIKAGLLPVSPEAIELIVHRGVCYHDYQGILVDEAERASIQSDLGPKAKVLFLRNHGVAIAASSISEAWYLVKRVVAACQTQMLMLQLGGGASMLAELKQTALQLEQAAESAALNLPGSRSVPELDRPHDMTANGGGHNGGKAISEAGDVLWTPEELEFEAEMRLLDSAGYRTGHIYRQPNLLRKANTMSQWSSPNDRFGGFANTTDATMLTTDFSAADFSGPDDVATAEKAGAEQMTKIGGNIQANRQKGSQRNQFLSRNDDHGVAAIASSTFVASSSPKRPQSPADLLNTSATPVRRPVINGTAPRNNNSPSTPQQQQKQPSTTRNGLFNRSATLPASSKQRPGAARSDTLDGAHLAGTDEELLNSNQPAKVKKRGSFRMPSFRKKKH